MEVVEVVDVVVVDVVVVVVVVVVVSRRTVTTIGTANTAPIIRTQTRLPHSTYRTFSFSLSLQLNYFLYCN